MKSTALIILASVLTTGAMYAQGTPATAKPKAAATANAATAPAATAKAEKKAAHKAHKHAKKAAKGTETPAAK